jgi:hypothetical protein
MSTIRVGWFVRLLILSLAFVLGPGVARPALAQCGNIGNACSIDEQCDDGVFCTGQEFCDNGTCACGLQPNCDDGFSCTFLVGCGNFPSLGIVDGCINVPLLNFCSDSLWCTGDEICDPDNPNANAETGCVAGEPRCDDGILCTNDDCNEALQICGAPVPDDTVCDDGTYCNGKELCDPDNPERDANGCVAGTYPCLDFQICDEDQDICRGCNTANECGGTFCAPLICAPIAGGDDGCIAGEPPCDDTFACTIDECDEVNGCSNTPNDNFCDDGNECTECFCDPQDVEADADGCVCIPVAGQPACTDDGFSCTDDVCIDGVCTHIPDDPACDDGNECTDCICDTSDSAADSAGCVCTAVADLSPCIDDGIGCTDDICIGGACSNVPDNSACDDGVDCTDDVCDPAQGCTNTTNDDNCTGGSFCDGFDVCDASAGCQPGTPPVCPSETPICDPISEQCVKCLIAEHCDNGVACDGQETCVLGACRPGTPVACDDGFACTVDTCTEPDGICQFTPNHSFCDDDNVCNGEEMCIPEDIDAAPNGCVAGTPLDCSDSRPCTDDNCDPTDGCSNPPNDANCTLPDFPYCDPESGFCSQCLTDDHCNDGNACNGEETCTENVCSGGVPIDCDDGIDCTIDECIDPAGECSHTPDDAYCDDGDFCNGAELCNPDPTVAGSFDGCAAGEPPDCNDFNDCTVDSCTNSACSNVLIDGCIRPEERRVSFSNKGSLLMFSKVEIKWDDTGKVLQDTFLSVTNDYPGNVTLLAFFINGDPPVEELRSNVPPFNIIRDAEPGWNKFSCRFTLTGNHPRFWSATSGGMGCPPFAILDTVGPGRPDPESADPSRMLRGYVIAWAVAFNGPQNQWQEVRWNHLDGGATIVNYAEASAWDYNAWKFRAHGVLHGQFTGTPGVLNLDALEYDAPFGMLLLDFYASRTLALSSPATTTYLLDTDLTLHPVPADLRQDNNGPPITKAEFEVWNESEAKFSGTRRCIQCWDETLLSAYSANVSIPNHFVLGTLGTNKGTARITGIASVECDNRPPFFKLSESLPLLGIAAKFMAHEGSDRRSMAGMNLIGAGAQPTVILYDPLSGPTELTKGDLLGRDLRNPRPQQPSDTKTPPTVLPERQPILRDSDIPPE